MALAQTLPMATGRMFPRMPLKMLGVMVATFLAAFALTPQQAEAHHKGRVAAGIVAGAIVAGALAHHHHYNKRYYKRYHHYHHRRYYRGSGYYHRPHHYNYRRVYHHRPHYYHSGRPAPWTPAWYSYCAAKYRSFDARSGTFQPYHGPRRLCR